jgi:hypothetical protein
MPGVHLLPATVVLVGEQALAGDLLAPQQLPGEAGVAQLDLLLLAALAREREADPGAVHVHVLARHRGQPDRPALLRLAVAADADQGLVEERDDEASTRSRDSDRFRRSSSTRVRIVGRAAAKAAMRWNLVASRTLRHRGW